jgi:hypothetical protein
MRADLCLVYIRGMSSTNVQLVPRSGGWRVAARCCELVKIDNIQSALKASKLVPVRIEAMYGFRKGSIDDESKHKSGSLIDPNGVVGSLGHHTINCMPF